MDAEVRNQLLRDISQYDGKRSYLGSLIGDLNAVWHAHEEWEADVRRRFRSEWITLEELYALALDRGDLTFSLDCEDRIAVALNNIAEILRSVG
jgi:hypothetical protein